MTPLNAIDAISPAFTRTHEVLFQPFRLGRTWKLSASSYLAFCGSVFVPFPIFLAFLPRNSALPFLGIAFAVATVLFLILFYLGARMEFVNFEMIVTRNKFIAPMWRRYAQRVWPAIAVKVVIGTLITAAMAKPLLQVFREYISLFAALPQPIPGQPPDPAIFQAQMQQFMSHMGRIYLVIYGFFFLVKIFSTLLDDFVIPFYILEDIPFAVAMRRGFEVFRADPLQVILYLFMKFILAIVGSIMYCIAFLVAEIILAIPLFIVVFIGILLAALLGAAGKVLLIVGGILVYGAFLFIVSYLAIGSFGYILTLLEAYGIYFLAGRYPLLGDLLQPGIDRPFTPPPVFPSEEERKDDDGGPPMPMNPAVA